MSDFFKPEFSERHNRAQSRIIVAQERIKQVKQKMDDLEEKKERLRRLIKKIF